MLAVRRGVFRNNVKKGIPLRFKLKLAVAGCALFCSAVIYQNRGNKIIIEMLAVRRGVFRNNVKKGIPLRFKLKLAVAGCALFCSAVIYQNREQLKKKISFSFTPLQIQSQPNGYTTELNISPSLLHSHPSYLLIQKPHSAPLHLRLLAELLDILLSLLIPNLILRLALTFTTRLYSLSIGKYILGLRVFDRAREEPAGVPKMFLREFLKFISIPITFLWFAFYGQFLHEQLTDTTTVFSQDLDLFLLQRGPSRRVEGEYSVVIQEEPVHVYPSKVPAVAVPIE
eukprot:TRINITY_DN805_c0_g3_i1.p1 TRINITY_DN805_c0_g3~~TRINITY_DN805_c0_g3_i1.p1  ORF type:complete len:298 (-),score=78.47 TRINITY_DN805_c0_g3_i1:18-869(-)